MVDQDKVEKGKDDKAGQPVSAYPGRGGVRLLGSGAEKRRPMPSKPSPCMVNYGDGLLCYRLNGHLAGG